MPPKGAPTLTREQMLSLEDDMIAAYCVPEFQQRLHQAWDAAGGNHREQVRARQEVCLPSQLQVITKYGFEASMRGVNHSVSMYTRLNHEPEFGRRGEFLTWLINPDLQRAPRHVDILIGQNQYTMVEAYGGYPTLALWKQRLEEGILGSKVLYASTLVCEAEYSRGEVYSDQLALPQPPNRLCVVKPGSVAKMLEIALRNKVGEPLWSPRFGDFIVRRSLGRGAAGVCVYLAQNLWTGKQGAVKWPAKPEEARAMLDIHKRAKGCFGIPELLQYGCYEEKQYIVTPVLGATLVTDFRLMQPLSVEERWAALCIIGRILLQRLETIHCCGFVHCDISPENILHGTSGKRNTIFLIDYGLAQRYPGGKPLKGDLGSAEWSSIRSAEGGERRPEDDLEALGWVLVHGLVGAPPWVKTLKDAYPEWGSQERRDASIRQVQRAKLKLLEEGWENMGAEFEMFEDVPEELWCFLRSCRSLTEAPHLPNYARLQGLLGAPAESSEAAMDAERTLEKHVLPFLRQAVKEG